MSRAYLFAEHLLEDKAPCLLLGDDQSIIEPLQTRSLEAYRTMVGEEESIIVLPTHWVSIHFVEVPKISTAKLRQAIPFMLEEAIAQPLEAVHFAYHSAGLHKGRFEVIVIDKAKQKALLQLLETHQVPFNALTIDWCALSTNMVVCSEGRVLFKSELYNGELLDKSAFSTLLNTVDWNEITFENEAQKLTWVALHLNPKHMINLCQGEFKPKLSSQGYKRWYQFALIATVAWFGVYLTLNLSAIVILNHRLEAANQRVLAHYKKFFPEASQVINPRFRIGQLLQGQDNDANEALWKLLPLLSKDFNPKSYTMLDMKWRNNALTITFEVQDFGKLEQFENKLTQRGIRVKQLQAKTENSNVQATLELKC